MIKNLITIDEDLFLKKVKNFYETSIIRGLCFNDNTIKNLLHQSETHTVTFEEILKIKIPSPGWYELFRLEQRIKRIEKFLDIEE